MFSDLPDGWEKATISDIVMPYSTVQPRKTPDNNFLYIDIGSIDNSVQKISQPRQILGKDAPSRARRVVKAGDVLFSTVRTYLKNIAIVPPRFNDALTSTGIAVIRTNDEVTGKYLFYFVQSDSFIRRISGDMDGTLYPAIKDSDLYSAPLLLPPLNEQHRIVTKIETLTARSRKAREALDAIPALLDQFRQSVLAAAFRGDLTADWREENPEVESAEELLKGEFDLPKSYKRLRKQLGKGFTNREGCSFCQLPNTWKYASINELYRAKIIIDYADGNHGSLYPRKSEFAEQGVTYITASQVVNGSVDFDSCTYLNHEKANQLIKGWACGGDVLLTHNATVGRTAIVPNETDTFLLGTSVTFYRTHEQGLNNRYLYHVFNSHVWQQQLNAVMQQTTRNQVSIQKQAFFLIPVPPIKEQLEIVRKIDSFLKNLAPVRSLLRTKFSYHEQLDQSILAKAFRGELVPQDPNDEPATVLLQRIQAEREKLKPKSKRKTRAKKK